jgi:hypothetical protein
LSPVAKSESLEDSERRPNGDQTPRAGCPSRSASVCSDDKTMGAI